MENVQLLGVESMQNAAVTMKRAAGEMTRAVNGMEYILRVHQAFMGEYMCKLEGLVEKIGLSGDQEAE